MPNLKLTYFDFDYGRAEPARLALTMAGIPFEDDRISHEEWPKRKSDMPFQVIPVLYVDGAPVSQSNTINRYVGRLSGFYPADPWQAALCDEAMDAVEDVMTQIVVAIKLSEEGRKAKLKDLASDMFPLYLTRLGKRLNASGGLYFADNRLTVADLKVCDLVLALKAGQLEHVPPDLPGRNAPNLLAHADRVQSDPRIKAYYEARAAKA